MGLIKGCLLHAYHPSQMQNLGEETGEQREPWCGHRGFVASASPVGQRRFSANAADTGADLASLTW